MDFFIKLIMVVTGIKGTFNFGGLEIPIVIRGDGLYADESIQEKYIYRGKNPNNYILFNDDLWRIVSISEEGIRIIRNSSIGDMAFDDNGFNEWNDSSLKKYLDSYYGDIGYDVTLISMDEFLSSSSDRKNCEKVDLYFKNFDKCFDSSYINFLEMGNASHAMWTRSGDPDGSNGVFYLGNTYFGDGSPLDEYGVLPIVILNSNIKLSGQGTLQKPYKIL